ncbi:MAG: hypothetical protein PHU40_08840 [Sulfurimonas sp.]|nr:hypothetical protein [Sulfurimonas sp.]
MLEEIFISLIVLFLLPIFPMSLATNFLLSKLKGLTLLFVLTTIFFLGALLLNSFENKTLIEVISILALFSTLFYALRLVSVSNAYNYLLFYYSTIAGFAWLWKSINGEMLMFFIAFILPIVGFGLLINFLDKQFGTTYFKAFKGLGTVMPRFSILFIISVVALILTPYFPGFRIFVEEIVHFDIYYLIVIAISWLFISWSGITMIEKLIYGVTQRKVHYRDLSGGLTAFIILIYLIGAAIGILFMEVNLG